MPASPPLPFLLLHTLPLLAVAMSQTFTGAADWSDYLQSTPSSTASIFADVISTDPNPNQTNFSFDTAPPLGSSNPTINRTNRVTKPARKRSRASRRTPTTLLSTNTSNFRAMVQQFTGGPSALGFGNGSGIAAIDHPQPRRVTDQQGRGIDGLGLISSSSSPYANPWSGYGFQVHHHVPAAEQAASDAIAKSEGGGSSFLY